jgi:hypothetical protein
MEGVKRSMFFLDHVYIMLVHTLLNMSYAFLLVYDIIVMLYMILLSLLLETNKKERLLN